MGTRGGYKQSAENADYLRRQSFKIKRKITNGRVFICGKYEGKTLNFVEKEDPQYFSWARSKRLL